MNAVSPRWKGEKKPPVELGKTFEKTVMKQATSCGQTNCAQADNELILLILTDEVYGVVSNMVFLTIISEKKECNARTTKKLTSN